MNGPRLTDAQISSALRAHVPEHAYPGLRERILDAAETTTQQRALPSFLGALSEADPVLRRRNLLIAAALLVALALASAAAVGALHLLERDPIHELSLEPPADLPAFVLSSYERLPQLPPVAFAWHDSGSAKGRVYVDRSGTVRFDRFTSAEATEPSSYTILSDHRVSGMARVDSEATWIEQGDEAIGDDPRVFLRTVLRGDDDGPGCEMERDPSAVGDGTAATGWRYIGVEYVAGRPTHHVACVGDLWLDIETRLILRTREPLTDDAGQPIPGQFRTTEVTEIAFGDQPATLFEPPVGVAHISSDAYSAYLCTRDLPNEEVVGLGARSECPSETEAQAAPPPTPTPIPTVRPVPGDCALPSPDPSQPTGPLAWTQASPEQDWPAPVRPEPAGAPSVLPMPPIYIDPLGDTGSAVYPCLDIRDLTVDTYDVALDLVSNLPPDVDPAKAWIAYGVVVDEDHDGVPDWRYGIDNLPRTAGDERSHHRAWRTDLHTGRTESAAGTDWTNVSKTYFATRYPAEPNPEDVHFSGDGARFRFGHVFDTTRGYVTRGIKLDMPLYTWASVIVDGRVVATDYAPDAGWLLPTPGTDRGGASTPDAQPGGAYTPDTPVKGTYLLEDPFPVRLSMTVADGWTAVAERRFYRAGSVNRDEGRTGIRFVMVDNLDKNACAKRAGAVDGRATIDDLVAFLEGLRLIDITKNTDVTLDGYLGRYLEFKRTAGEIDCGWGGLDGWPASSPSARDEVDRVWILDVDGAPLVIDAFSSPGASEGVRAELRQMVESIQIES